jgi:glycosyltransferase involved in cell wall biosynthesis
MKIVLLYSGWKERAHFFAKALEKYFDVVLVGQRKNRIKVEEEGPEVNWRNLETFDFRKEKYDLIFGLDHGCSLWFKEMRKFTDKKLGTTILDIPEHVFMKNKDYNEDIVKLWRHIYPTFKDLDFVISNRLNISEKLKTDFNFKKPSLLSEYPFNVPRFEKRDRKNFIVYSGATNPTKGVHYLLSALGKISNPPTLKIISYTGDDLQPMIDYLKIPVEFHREIPHKEKFELYWQSLFLVGPTDNSICPPMSIFEGISIGRMGIVFSYEEMERSYRESVQYVSPLNISELAYYIDLYSKKVELADEKAKVGIEYYNKCWTYESWAKRISDFLNSEVF